MFIVVFLTEFTSPYSATMIVVLSFGWGGNMAPKLCTFGGLVNLNYLVTVLFTECR